LVLFFQHASSSFIGHFSLSASSPLLGLLHFKTKQELAARTDKTNPAQFQQP
jgi:hypothetical protein